ncbi:ankyrin repeat-containing domain protein, partial [Fusarium oxysporum f. sp. albedinis]
EAIVTLLVPTEGIDVNSKDEDRRTPLLWVSENEHKDIVKLLLAKASANTEDTIGRHHSHLNGYDIVAMAILSHKAIDVDQKGHYGSTLLSIAVRNCLTQIVKVLLATGQVNFDTQDCFGGT